MVYGRCAWVLLGLVGANQLYAAQANATLQVQITLLPSCRINQGVVTDGDDVGLFGVFDFGATTAGFGVVETGLNAHRAGGVMIECPAGVNATITFGAGLHDDKVPDEQQGRYHHALSNGQHYVAYNLYVDSRKQAVMRPSEPINIPGGQPFQLLPHALAIGAKGLSQGSYTDTIAVTIDF